MKTLLRLFAAACLASALLSCKLFDYSDLDVHKYALVYGTTVYSTAYTNPVTTLPAAAGPNLQYPDADAKGVAEMLSSHGFVISKSRWVDGSGEVWVDGADTGKVGSLLTDNPDGSSPSGQGPGDPSAPSKSNILSDLANLAQVAGPNDVVLVYFSGHGSPDVNPPAVPTHVWIDPYGSVMDIGTAGQYNYSLFDGLAIRDDELKASFDAFKTPRKVLIIDTCNSGGFIGNQLEEDWTPPVTDTSSPAVGLDTLRAAIHDYLSFQSSSTGLSPYGAEVLAAAGKGEECYESNVFPNGTPLNHGVMTYFLLQTARKADLNNDGHVTVLEAFSWVRAGIETNRNPTYAPYGQAFEPHISGGPVDFVLF